MTHSSATMTHSFTVPVVSRTALSIIASSVAVDRASPTHLTEADP